MAFSFFGQSWPLQIPQQESKSLISDFCFDDLFKMEPKLKAHKV